MKKNAIVYSLLVVVFAIVALFCPSGDNFYGVWSLVPIVGMFAFSMATKRIIEGFVWASILAVFMKYRVITLSVFTTGLVNQFTNPDTVNLVILLSLIGALIGILDKSKVTVVFGEWAASKAKGEKKSLLLTFISSAILSFDGYLSTSSVATSMVPINGKFNVPKEMTAFTVRSAAVPAATFNPISTSTIFVASLLVINNFVPDGQGLAGYFKIAPFIFFDIILMVIALLAIFGLIPKLGAMKKAYEEVGDVEQAEAINESAVSDVSGEENTKKMPHLINYFIPIVTFIGSTIAFDFNTKYGLLVTLLVTGVAFVAQGIFTPDEYVDTILDGMKELLPIIAMNIIGLTMVQAVSELGFSDYIISFATGSVSGKLLPFIIFLIFGITEFFLTLNWGLWMMTIPTLIPLAAAVGANPYLTIGALLSAGLWGVNTCIISDVGMLTAYSSKIDLYKHYITNLPYNLLAMVLAAIGYLAAGFIF